MVAPSVSAESPALDDLGVDQTTDLFFHVGGVDGVTQSSIVVDVQIGDGPSVTAVAAGVPLFPYDEAGSLVSAQGDGYDVTANYRGRFPKNAIIRVRINADDNFAASMDEVEYTFTTDAADAPALTLVQIVRG